ncbi:hypothetical protein ACFPRL_15905 [Pseudoclavibacter helvolus]
MRSPTRIACQLPRQGNGIRLMKKKKTAGTMMTTPTTEPTAAGMLRQPLTRSARTPNTIATAGARTLTIT